MNDTQNEQKKMKELLQNLSKKIEDQEQILTQLKTQNYENNSSLNSKIDKNCNMLNNLDKNIDSLNYDLTVSYNQLSSQIDEKLTLLNSNFDDIKNSITKNEENYYTLYNSVMEYFILSRQLLDQIKSNQENYNQTTINKMDSLANNFEDSTARLLNLLQKNQIESKDILTKIQNKQIEYQNLITTIHQNQNNSKELLSDLLSKQELLVNTHHESIVQLNDIITKQSSIQSSVSNLNTLTQDNNNLQKEEKIKIQKYLDIFDNHIRNYRKYFFKDQEHLMKDFDTNLLFQLCYFGNIEFLTYSPEENRVLLKTKEGIIFNSNNRLFTVLEVLALDGYAFPQLYSFDEFVVFDIGMNRAYASLKFANYENCKKVYGFEINKNTYDLAKSNIKLNKKLDKKIKTYNYGLSNKNDNLELYYLEGRDGLSTLFYDFVKIQPELANNINDVKTCNCPVKKASDVLEDLIKKEKIKSKIVLKIDTEGSEYDIIQDLIENGLINKMDVILGEGHIFNDENMGEKLLKNGFKQLQYEKGSFTFNFIYIKEKYFEKWSAMVV